MASGSVFKLASAVSLVSLLLLLLPQKMSAEKIYHNQFAVQIEGGKEAADLLAEKHGLVNMGQIGALKGHFLLEFEILQGVRQGGTVN